jgi:hypothetical protein
MVLGLPGTPKLTDVVAVLIVIDQRLAELEAYVVRNDDRITALETRYDIIVAERGARIAELEAIVHDHQVGAVARRRQIEQLEALQRKDRWALKHRRTP